MKNAGVSATQNTDLVETAGMATLGGPLTGIISELAGLGSSIKQTFAGAVNKFRRDRGNRGTGDRSVDAQIAATSEVTTAVEASATAAAQQNQQIISAISALDNQAAGPIQSAGRIAHRQATSHEATAAAPTSGMPVGAGTGTNGRQPSQSSGGMFSRIRDNISDRAVSLLPLAKKVAIPVAAAIGIGAWFKGAEKDYNDSVGQKEAFALKDGEQANAFMKALYAVTGYKTEKQQEKEKSLPTGALALAIKASQAAVSSALAMVEEMGLPKIQIKHTRVGKQRSTEQSAQSTEPIPAEVSQIPTTANQVPLASAHAATRRADVPLASSHAPAAAGKGKEYRYTGLGSLSEYHESRGDAGVVAPDVKGFAYGKFQMHSKGTVGEFIKQSPWAKDFEGMKPGSKEYNEQWPKTAAKDPKAFASAQFDSIKKTHYAPTEKKAKKLGIDTTDPMLQEVLFSTGTQHGPGGGPEILDKAFPTGVDPKKLSKDQIRERIYAERGRKNASGELVHFPRVEGKKAQDVVSNRFVRENKDAATIGALSSSAAVTSKIGQPIEQAVMAESPTAAAASTPTIASQQPAPEPQPSAIQLPAAVATIRQSPLPVPVPISPPKMSTQSAHTAGSGGDSSGAQSLSSRSGGFNSPQVDRRPDPPHRQFQTSRQPSVIPFEFDDILLTLLARDLR